MSSTSEIRSAVLAFAAAAAATGCAPVRDVGVADLAPTSAANVAVAAPAFTLFFDAGSADFTAEAAAVLAAVVADHRRTGFGRIIVAGHADRSGPERGNAELSRQRAAAVRAYLIGAGLPPDLIVTEAYGEGKALVATSNGSAEPQNRRVEIFVERGSTAKSASHGRPD